MTDIIDIHTHSIASMHAYSTIREIATMAKEKGLDNLEVKALLAHTNISTTQKYMGEFDTQRDDAALGKVFKKDDDAEKLLKQLQGVNPELLKEVLERLAK